MSSAQVVTDADWEVEVLKSETPVLVDFWAEWCGPCKMVSPIVDQLAAENAGALKVVKLNVDDSPEVSRKYRVLSIPTLLLIANGEEKRRLIGARPKSALLDEIAEFL